MSAKMSFTLFFIFFSAISLSSSYLLPLDRETNSLIQFMIPFGGFKHRHCFLTLAKTCFLKTYQENNGPLTTTWTEAYMGKEKTDIDWDPLINIQYTGKFILHFDECSAKAMIDLIKPNIENIDLKDIIVLEKAPKNVSLPFGSEILIRYQKAVYSTIQNCIRSIPCFIKIHKQIISNILEDCTKNSYKQLAIPLEEYYETVTTEKEIYQQKPLN